MATATTTTSAGFPDGTEPPEHELILPADWQHTHTFQNQDHWYAELVADHAD